MIAKAVKGRGFRGALAYDLGKNEGRVLDTNLSGSSLRELSAEFGAIRKLRPNLERAVLHVSLSAAPGEKLSDEQWSAIARWYLEGMALNDNQYVVTRHTDTEHEHVHILANRITYAGQVVSDSQDFQRQEVLMRAIERDFGLQQLAPSRESERRAPTRGEIEKQIRTADVSTRVQLQQLADAAVARSSTYSQYREHLQAAGVELVPVLQQEGAKLSGLMYRLDGVTMKGSDLGKGYSPAGLARRGVSYEQGRDAAAVRAREEQDQPRAAGRTGPDDPRGQGAERGGAERDARAAGPGDGRARQQSGRDLERDRAEDAEHGRGLRAPGPGGERQPGEGDPGHRQGDGRPGTRGQQLELGALPPERGDGPGDGSARERVLALAQAAQDARCRLGPEGGSRIPEAGADRGDEERQRAGQAGKDQVAVSTLRRVIELARLERERDARVREVLARAEQRPARRQEILRRLVQARPEAAQGLATALQQKTHQQALRAWESAKEAAVKLVEQARRLAVRLVEAAQPKRVAAWARQHLQRGQPGRSKADRARAAQVRSVPPVQQVRAPQTAQQAPLFDPSRLSIQDQCRVYDRIIAQLTLVGQVKVQRVAIKVAKRLKRREDRLAQSRADPPSEPRGLLAAFKKGEYDRAVEAYRKRVRPERLLVEQATKLQKDVLEAIPRSGNWAARKLRQLQPEFAERVERHVRSENLLKQLAELDRRRTRERERGINGPEQSR